MMEKRTRIALLSFLILALPGIAFSQQITKFESAFYSWLPVVVAGMMLSLMVCGVQYFVGVIIANNRVKSGAIGKFLQVAGTMLILVILILSLNYFGQVLTFSQFFPNTETLKLCTQLGWPSNTNGGPDINFLNAGVGVDPTTGLVASLPAGPPYIPEPPKTLCDLVSAAPTSADLTTHLDYGLATTYIIIDNLTNQTTNELNDLYDFENLVYFLRSYKMTYAFCIPITCTIPFFPTLPETTGTEFSLEVSQQYFDGYVFGRVITPTITTEMNLMFYLYLLQLTGILIMLTAWPYLLAAGVVLRAFDYTRSVGGLLIALVVVSLLIYPLVVMFQYNSLKSVQNLQPNNIQYNPGATTPQVLGPTTLPNLALCGRSWADYPTYTINDGIESAKHIVLSVSVAPAVDASHRVKGQSDRAYVKDTLAGVFCYTAADILPANYIFRGIVTDNYKKNGLPTDVHACDGTGFSDTQQCFVKRPINFYVFPKTRDIVNLYSFWPGDDSTVWPDSGGREGGIVPVEVLISMHDVLPVSPVIAAGGLIPGVNVAALFAVLYGASTKFGLAFPTDFAFPVDPHHIINAYLSLQNIYAILAVPGYVIPIIDVLIMFSATTGLSQLLGGETNIVGLSRFL